VRERALRAIIGSVVVVAAFAAPAGASESTARQSLTSVPALEEAVVAEVNAARRRRGLRSLRPARGLHTAANRHTVLMLQRGVFAHEIPGGPRFVPRLRRHYSPRSRGWSVAENLAAAWPEPTGAEIARMWLASPSHRRNLLSPLWREIGVAAVHALRAPGDFGDAEITLVTADFGVRG
jgi:uncharacterized protein YkwD